MLVLLTLLCAIPLAVAAQPCGPDAACQVDAGEYHLALPPGWNGTSPLPAVLFFHGHRSSGARVVNAKGLREAFVEQGYLLIAPTGSRGANGATGWPARPDATERRDDIAFTLRVLDDVAKRLPLDERRLYATGFSAGGSMAWMLACYVPQRFAGFASIAGGLRRPVPQAACPGGPARLIHFHGFADKQVPLEGRAIRDWHQGDVFESLALLRAANGCHSNPTRFERDELFQCRVWDGCGSERDIAFCLHDGGHGLPRGWTVQALRWFERPSR